MYLAAFNTTEVPAKRTTAALKDMQKVFLCIYVCISLVTFHICTKSLESLLCLKTFSPHVPFKTRSIKL